MISSRAARFVLVAAAVIVIGLYLALPPLSRTAAFRTQVERALASATGYAIMPATIAIGYDLSVAVGEVSLAAPQQPPFLRARKVEIPLWTILTRRAARLRVEEPHLFLDHLPQLETDGGVGMVPIGGLQIVNGFAHYTTARGEVVVGPLSLHIDSLAAGPSLALRGRSEMALAALAQPLQLPGVLEGSAEATVQLSGTLRDLQGSGRLQVQGLRWQGDGWVLASGDVTVPFDLGERAADGLRGTAEIAVAGVEFHDADRLRAGEKLRVHGKVEVTRGPAGPPSLRFDLHLAEGEVLWERMYTDLKQHGTTLRGELQEAPEGIQLRDVVLRADGIGSVTLNGSAHPGSGRSAVRVRMDLGGLNQLYAMAVRDALREVSPFLASSDAGGALKGDVEYRRSGQQWSLTGDVHLVDGDAVATDPPLELRGLDIDLPVALGTQVPGAAAAQTGSVHLAALRLGGVQIPETSAALSIVPNAVRLAAPLSVPVLGGTFVLHELEVTQLASPHRQANLGFALHELDLAQLSAARGWPSLRGNMQGDVPRVSIADGEIRSDGQIRAQVFGGEVQVGNLRVRQLSSSVPTLEMDVDVQDILLARLTETLEVGSISGVARGAIHDLAIVHGEPLRFDAWMETVSRSGVPQRISVKAIRQLSTLGGAGSDPLSQGLLSFFDEYRYAKMGFRCQLENDRFLLHGVEQIDGKEYLVVGTFVPPRVNVISHNQVISFSEMVERLRRVTAKQGNAAEGSK